MLKVYGKGDHPTGYQGIRVDTTVAGQRIQRYYETDEQALAEREHAALRQRAEAHKRENRLWGPLFVNQMARGLTAYIHREVKRKNGHETVQFVAVFRVSMGREGHREFRIKTLGYRGAYQQAVDCYIRHWGLEKYRDELLRRLPQKDWFLQVLGRKAKEKWRQLSLDDLREQIQNRP